MKKISRRNFLTSVALAATLPLTAKESKTSKQSLKFIHATDTHLDWNDKETIDALKLMVEFINENYQDLDFVCFGGDNFNNNIKGNKDALLFKEITDKLHCKTLHVRGNKEAFPNPNDSIHLSEFQNLFVKDRGLIINGKDWAYEKNGYIFLGLDSGVEGKNNGLYEKDTISFAKKMLDKGKPTIALNHHPYTNFWGEKKESMIHNYVLNNTKEVQKELFSYDNLLLTLSGHKHMDSTKEVIHGTKVIATRGFVRMLDMDMFPMRYVEMNGKQISEKLIYTE